MEQQKVLFSEDFKDNSNKWLEKTEPALLQVDVENQCYKLFNKTDKSLKTYLKPEVDLPDAYQIKFIIEYLSGTSTNGLNLIFNRKADQSHLSITLSPNGKFNLWRRISMSKGEFAHPWTHTPHINKDFNIKNEVLVKVWPDHFAFYINGSEVAKLSEKPIDNPTFGFLVPKKVETVVHSVEIFETSETEIEALEKARAAVLGEAILKLDEMVGMPKIKEQIRTLTNMIRVQKKRDELGMSKSQVGNHMVLLGPPGTGKTTVARILGEIFKNLGVLSNGHVIETDRAGLVAEFIGQTAPKVEKIVNEAKGGILFIDEAYTLKREGGSGRDFGQEAIDTLMKRMEDDREDFIVVIAGYENKMSAFLNSNPGIQSRFNHKFEFIDYNPQELLEIFKYLTEEAHYKLKEATEVKALEHLTSAYKNRSNSFGNGRYTRNMLESMIQNQANRLASDPDLDADEVTYFEPEDVPEELLSGTEIKPIDESNQYL